MKRDHTKLICDVGELSGLFSDTRSLEAFLQRIAEVVSGHMHSAVCSIYLWDEETEELVLKATKGLHPEAVGKVRLQLGEGLTGLAVQQGLTLCERNASQSPAYRHFPDIGEEPFESFLAVPMARGRTPIGAMVIQNARKDYFTPQDVRAFQAITCQMANTIEMAKVLMGLTAGPQALSPAGGVAPKKALKLVKGKVGSEGFAFAQAVVLDSGRSQAPGEEVWGRKKYSLEDFTAAVETTERQLKSLQQQVEEKLADVASWIFAAQILMLKDKAFIDEITALIGKGVSVPQAVVKTVEDYARRFENLSNEYLREKERDVRDMGRRLLHNLTGADDEAGDYRNRLVIAQDIYPSDILKFFSQKAAGVILLSGGATSHLAILARSLGMPLVIAQEPRLLQLPPKTKILLDARQGNIHVNPSREIVSSCQRKEADRVRIGKLRKEVHEATYTKDGVRVTLLSNINLLGDLETARAVKAEGVGLYRTEFPFMIRSDFPSEEEQFMVYKKLVEGMPGREVVFRTLDIGGDKVLSYYDYGKEENPFLGMRSIRFSLKHKEIFAAQLRAILRAGAGMDAPLKIMFPMISSLDEFAEARKILKGCMAGLRKEKAAYHQSPQIGVMIELPAVLEIIDELAREADFFSIGTNDFVQYMLAVDRTNEKVADFYLPHHPAVLRALKKIAAAAQQEGIEVTVCGDMAHQEPYIPYLLGIGVRRLSLDTRYIPRIQAAVEKTDCGRARHLTERLLKASRISEIEKSLAQAS